MGRVDLPLAMRPEEMTGNPADAVQPRVSPLATAPFGLGEAAAPRVTGGMAVADSAVEPRAMGKMLGVKNLQGLPGTSDDPGIKYDPNKNKLPEQGPQLPQEAPLRMVRQGITPAHWEQQGASLRGTPGQMQAVADLQESGQQAQASHATAQQAELDYAQQQASAQDIADVQARKQNQLVESAQRARMASQEARLDDIKASIDKHNALAAPDPAKFWQGLGFAGSIGMIAAGFLDHLAAGMGRRQPANVVEQAIDRSLRAQQAAIDKSKANIDEQKGLYAQFRSAGLDSEAAAQATKARRLEDASTIVASIARQASIPQKRAALEQQAIALKEKAAQQRLELSKILPGEGMGVQRAASGGGIDYQATKFENEMRNDLVKRQHIRAQTAGEMNKLEHEGSEKMDKIAEERGDLAGGLATAERVKRNGPPTLTEKALHYISPGILGPMLAPQAIDKRRDLEALAEFRMTQQMKVPVRGEVMYDKAFHGAYGNGGIPKSVSDNVANDVISFVRNKQASTQAARGEKAVQGYKRRLANELGKETQEQRTKDLADHLRK